MSQVGRAFESSSKVEIGYAGSDHDMTHVYGDLAKFSQRLLRPSRELGLDESYSGRFDTFGTQMLSRSQRHQQMHATDVMIVSVLAKALVLTHEKKLGEARAGQIVNGMLSELGDIRGMSPVESGSRARSLRSRHKKSSPNYDRIRASPAEHVCLYNCLLDLGGF